MDEPRVLAPRVLLVDDDPGIREALDLLFDDRGGYEFCSAASGSDALARLAREAFHLLLCDVAMPGMDGITLLEEVRRQWPDLPVLMISAHGELELAVRAVRAGAYDYLQKPLDPERLFHAIGRALELHRLRNDYRALRAAAGDEFLLLGESEAMQRLRSEIARAAPSEARILILGENGTGKELVARQIHEQSRRATRTFVKINSAAIPHDLIESELFGHEAGAFTGATKARKGKFEVADGGTLFLDEIGDMSPDTQAKLLRVLSTGELERVGGSRAIRFDVRVISATNRDLMEEEAKKARFREDLYHRLAVIPIRVPPLRERGADVALLAHHFLAQSAANYGRPAPRLTVAAHALLQKHPWPGNVRELRNLMERIVIMHAESEIEVELLKNYLTPRAATHGPESPEARGESPTSGIAALWKAKRSQEERGLIERLLDEAGWNVTLAAERLGIDRASLHRKMRRFGIERPGRQPDED